MARWFPQWRAKTSFYRPALTIEESASLERVREARAPWRGPGVSFLWLGRWSAHKGTRRLSRFVRERLQARPMDRVTIAGCGELHGLPFPDEWLAQGRVRVIAGYPRSELGSLLAQHDVGLFTSDVEGWGISLNEMIESGMPVYATEAGGVSDLRELCPGCILPFPPPAQIDVNALRAGMVVSREYYAACDWDHVAVAYERWIREAAGSRPCTSRSQAC